MEPKMVVEFARTQRNSAIDQISERKVKQKLCVCLGFRSVLQSIIEPQLTLSVFSSLLFFKILPFHFLVRFPHQKSIGRPEVCVNAYLLLQNLSAMLDDASFDFTLTGSSSSNWEKIEENENQGNNKSW
jgi:hypothetical protein